jgi:hypothetical protein
VAGLTSAPGPLTTTGFLEFDFDIPEPLPGTYAIPPEDNNDVHQDVRRQEAAMNLIDGLFRPGGTLTNPCEGPCDPE